MAAKGKMGEMAETGAMGENGTPTGLALRMATPADVPLVLDFIRKLAAYEQLSHLVRADEAALHAALFGARPVIEAVLAEVDGAPVGFAVFYANISTFEGRPGLFVEDLFVLPDARGQGVGTALMARMAAIVRERGWGRMEWAVLDWNKNALEIYEKLGAKPRSQWLLHRLDGDALAALADRSPR